MPRKTTTTASTPTTVQTKNIFDVLGETQEIETTKQEEKGSKKRQTANASAKKKADESNNKKKQQKQQQKTTATISNAKKQEPEVAPSKEETPKQKPKQNQPKQQQHKKKKGDHKFVKKKDSGGFFGAIQQGIYILIFICLVGFLVNKGWNILEKNTISPIGQFVSTDKGGKINYWCEGPKSSKLVAVYVSDFGSSYLQSFNLLKQLSQNARVCAFDRSGRGLSDSPVGQYTINNTLAELDTFMSKSGEKGPFVLVGHSYGALVSSVYALQHPSEDIKGLVLLNPVGSSFYVAGGNKITESLSKYISAAEVLSLTGAMRVVEALGFLKNWGYDFNSEIKQLLKYNLNQQRVYQLADNELNKQQPSFVDTLTQLVQNDKKKLNQAVHVIYSDLYDSSNMLSSEVNTVWSNIIQTETAVKELSSKTTATNISGDRYFPVVQYQETAKQIKAFFDKL